MFEDDIVKAKLAACHSATIRKQPTAVTMNVLIALTQRIGETHKDEQRWALRQWMALMSCFSLCLTVWIDLILLHSLLHSCLVSFFLSLSLSLSLCLSRSIHAIIVFLLMAVWPARYYSLCMHVGTQYNITKPCTCHVHLGLYFNVDVVVYEQTDWQGGWSVGWGLGGASLTDSRRRTL